MNDKLSTLEVVLLYLLVMYVAYLVTSSYVGLLELWTR
jgi:hypothetical protein